MTSGPVEPNTTFTRRTFLKTASAAAVVAPATQLPDAILAPEPETFGKGTHGITLRINGSPTELKVEPRTTLLDALRDRLDLTGTKKICDRGACGGCTVLLDGRSVNACMMLALDAVGHEIATIEGLSAGDRLHPLQQAFIDHDALQCGFCTPGMVMSGVACLSKHEKPTAEQIRHEMSGNLCRCGTYGRVFDAIEQTAKGGRR